MWDLVIKNGIIVNSTGRVRADISISSGKIAAIGNLDEADAARVINAQGNYVIPGMIDSHAHIESGTGEMKSGDTYYSGSIAAAYGGTTSFIDFAFNNEGEKPGDAMRRKLREAEGESILDYSFHPCINSLDDRSMDDVRYYLRNGFPSVKLFTVYRGTLMLEKQGIYKVLQMVKEENGIALIHAESADMIERSIADAVALGRTTPKDHAVCRPVITELEAMHGILAMAQDTGAAVIFAHMTTGRAKGLFGRAGDARLYAEVCPHYLILDEAVYENEDGCNYVCSPPMRGWEDRESLWDMVMSGEVSMVNSDHTDYSVEQKTRYKNFFPKIPNGLPTIETRGMALFSEGVVKRGMSMERFVELTSTSTAKLMGIYPQKGVLQPGSDGDIVIINPETKYVMRAEDMHMATDFCPYEGRTMTGRVEYTIARGDVLIADGTYTGSPHRGNLLKRSAPAV